MTEMPRARATCATAGTDAANSGPRMISAPSSTACCALAPAPCALPPSSLIRSWMFGFWNSASAISAAFLIDCAATPALPEADSGRINPTLTCPEPTAVGSCGGPAGPVASGGTELAEALLNAGAGRQQRRAEHQANRTPPGRALGHATRKVRLGIERARHLSLRLTDRNRSGFLPSARQGMRIQAYCRRIVNQNKRFMVPGAAAGHLPTSPPRRPVSRMAQAPCPL